MALHVFTPFGRLLIKNVPSKGRGIFAAHRFGKNDQIDLCPVIVVPDNDVLGVINHYTFMWGAETCAIALGYGSLFNHSARPNAWYEFHRSRKLIEFRAAREIRSGTEITINYGYTPQK